MGLSEAVVDKPRRTQMELNLQQFNLVVSEAKRRAPHILSHIEAAAQMLLDNPFIWEVPGGLEILSETTGKTYIAGTACQCEAFKFGKPCRHRVAASLIYRYNEQRGH